MIIWILFLYNSVIDYLNVFIVRFIMFNIGYFFKNIEYKGSVVIGWGIFFFFVCCWGFFFIGYICDRLIIILEFIGGYR